MLLLLKTNLRGLKPQLCSPANLNNSLYAALSQHYHLLLSALLLCQGCPYALPLLPTEPLPIILHQDDQVPMCHPLHSGHRLQVVLSREAHYNLTPNFSSVNPHTPPLRSPPSSRGQAKKMRSFMTSALAISCAVQLEYIPVSTHPLQSPIHP